MGPVTGGGTLGGRMPWCFTGYSLRTCTAPRCFTGYSLATLMLPRCFTGYTLATLMLLRCFTGYTLATLVLANPCLSVAKYSIFQAKTSSGLRLALQCTHYGCSSEFSLFYDFPSQTSLFPRENSTLLGGNFVTLHALGFQNPLKIHA